MIECTFTNKTVISIATGFQYDTGQTLKINGLPALPAHPEMHFAIDETPAGVFLADYANGVLTCPIPDAVMQHVYWRAFIYVPTETSGTTLYAVDVKLKARPPRGNPLTPNQVELADQLISKLNDYNNTAEDAAKAAAESAADAARSAEKAAEDSELQVASATVLGGIKVGSNLIIDNAVLSVDTASEITQGVTKPVTADAVKTAYGTLSNIDIETLINSVV
jgi:hypothetical protein